MIRKMGQLFIRGGGVGIVLSMCVALYIGDRWGHRAADRWWEERRNPMPQSTSFQTMEQDQEHHVYIGDGDNPLIRCVKQVSDETKETVIGCVLEKGRTLDDVVSAYQTAAENKMWWQGPAAPPKPH